MLISRRSQIAITRFFDGETAESLAETLQAEERARAQAAPPPALPQTATAAPRRADAAGLTPAPRIIPQRDAAARRPSLLFSILLFPFSLVWRIANGTIGLIYLIFPFLPRFRALQQTPTPTTKRSLNPRDTAARFVRSFEEEYGSTSGLTWFDGGYAQALDLAKKDLRFLLVVLQSDEHDDTSAFNRHTLTSPEVVSFLKAHNIILWGGSVRESEGFQVACGLDCTKFPFAALITHAPNTPPGASSQGMSVVARVTGAVTPSAFTQKLQNALNTHSPALERIRAQRAAQAADRLIRDMQNSAYEASLARDRQRARERREVEEAARRVQEQAERRAAEAAALARNQEQWRKWRASNMPPEPKEGAVARVSIRTPDGERVLRRFESTTSMEEVYAFVDCLGVECERGEARPVGYEHEYSFRLVSPMPRKVYLPDETTVGQELWPNGNLVVESLVDDDDDEE